MNVPRHSPSSLNLFAASTSMFVLERILGHRQPMGAPAHRGTAVEAGVAMGLLDPKASLDVCVAEASRTFDTLMALNPDPRRESYAEDIPAMVEGAIDELRPYGIPTRTQGLVEWHPEGLKAHIMGYFDFEWEQHGIIVDLKTTEKMPSAIKPPHARQVALYAPSNNYDARLTYVTPKKRSTYQLENIAEHRAALYEIARRVEAFLALSDDPKFFTTITAPDVESYFWSSPPSRQLAFEHWRI